MTAAIAPQFDDIKIDFSISLRKSDRANNRRSEWGSEPEMTRQCFKLINVKINAVAFSWHVFMLAPRFFHTTHTARSLVSQQIHHKHQNTNNRPKRETMKMKKMRRHENEKNP